MRSEGQVMPAVLITAGMGFVVAVALVLLGLLAPLDAGLISRLGDLFGGGESPLIVNPALGVALAGFASFGLSWALLNTPGTQRRIILWGVSLLLIAGLSPVFALFGAFLSPFAPLVACLWSGTCAVIYGMQHRMPCES